MASGGYSPGADQATRGARVVAGGCSGFHPAVPLPRWAVSGDTPQPVGKPPQEKNSTFNDRRAVSSRRGAASPARDLPPRRGEPAENPASPVRGLSHLLPRTREDRTERGKPVGSPPSTPHPPKTPPEIAQAFTGLEKMLLLFPITGVFRSESKAEIKEHPPESEGTVLIWIIVAYSSRVRFIFLTLTCAVMHSY